MAEARDMQERRAGQLLTLTPEAVDQYRAAGWHITAGGRPNLGAFAGPCVRCQTPTTRYGAAGQPHCPDCRPGDAA